MTAGKLCSSTIFDFPQSDLPKQFFCPFGSRILFHLVEAVRGKPIKPEREAMVHLIGMVFLLGMMVFFTYQDIVRIFFN